MATDNTRYVTQEVLNYYDSQIKEYIQNEIDSLKDNATKDDIARLEKSLNEIENIGIQNSRDIVANKDHIDENEADIKDLQEEDKLINKELSDIKVSLQNKVDEAVLKDFATKSFVETSIRAAALEGKVDLSDYYTKDETNSQLSELRNAISDVAHSADTLADKTTEITRLGVDHERRLDDLSLGVASKAEREHSHHLSDIVDYKEPDLSNYLTSEEVANLIKTQIESIEFPEPDLSDYYTKNEVQNYIEDVVEDFVTESDINVLNEIIAKLEVDLESKADKDELANLPSKEFVEQKIQEAIDTVEVDLTGYATEEWVQNQEYLTEPDLQDYAKTEDLYSSVNVILQDLIDKGQITIPVPDSIKYEDF